jgi:hypothetical protein
MPFFRLRAVLVLLALMTGSLRAQQRISSFLIRPERAPTTSGILNVQGDTTTVEPSLSLLPKQKSGSLAMVLSAVLPGAGQVYAERYYTIPLVWGFGGYFVSQWIKADQRYHDYQSQFKQSVALDTVGHTGYENYRILRDFYHDQRDQFAIYIGLTYILNIIDAYVGASLYGFEVSDNLGNASIRFRIPIR